MAIVDLEQNTGYTLSAQQTEAGLASQADTAAPAHQSRGNRVDFYLGHLAYCQSYFPPQVRYVVGDGYYTKDKWVEGVVQLKLHAIGKLRCDALLLYRCYKARFQIEFIFRDARQFSGLADCQARSPEALDSHVNASLMALNLAKAALQQQRPTHEPLSFSIASYKRLALTEPLLDLFISMFELEPTLIKSHPNYPTTRTCLPTGL